MDKELYNLGRVTGLSAYELSVKHQLEENPELPSMTEKEWLAATLTTGASMILEIPANTPPGVHNFPLPSNSTLCSASNLIAYPFFGSCEVDSGGWATSVISYGPLIDNVSYNHPGDTDNPEKLVTNVPESEDVTAGIDGILKNMADYNKIVDGIIYQSGYWSPSNVTRPAMTFKPDLSVGATIRLYIRETITRTIFVLFTGLVNRSVIAGASKFDSDPVKSLNKANGDFIGPEVYPWSSKIIFVAPTALMQLNNAYVENISTDPEHHAYAATIEVDGKSVSAVALENNKGEQFDLAGSSGVVDSELKEEEFALSGVSDLDKRYLTWKALLDALSANKKIDVLGFYLQRFREFLHNVSDDDPEDEELLKRNYLLLDFRGTIAATHGISTQRNLYAKNDLHIDGSSYLNSGLVVTKKPKKSDDTFYDESIVASGPIACNEYVKVGGYRLYVSSVEPQSTESNPIPDGSLGIGW